jgi:hypothetical protein
VSGLGRIGRRFGGATADDLPEDVFCAAPVLRIERMVFVPGLGDEPAEGIIVFRLQDECEQLLLFPGGTGLFHVPVKQVSQSCGCFHIAYNKVNSGRAQAVMATARGYQPKDCKMPVRE